MAATTPKPAPLKAAASKTSPTTASPAAISPPSVAQQTHGTNDVAEMVEEIAVAVAAGIVPFLGQAINIYDMVDCLLTLRNSKDPVSRAEAKFDLVLAVIGWIPGAGGGVKKTVRIVNKNPDRYAPIMFDVLRMVLVKLEIYTSPEVLLAQLFDAPALQRVLLTVQLAIEESWIYEEMPEDAQIALKASMAIVRAELPAMVGLVAKKLTHWKTKQRNNAARQTTLEKKVPQEKKPDKLDDATAKDVKNTPDPVKSNGVTNVQIGTWDLSVFTKTVTGMLGEHITDYFLLENYLWGRDWTRHDIGDSGSWKVMPGLVSPGKLNDDTKLNKLFPDKARGTGIDGVWRVADGTLNNRKKKYAIVESKASVVCVPTHGDNKPPIDGKLGHNKKDADVLLEPDTCELSIKVKNAQSTNSAPAKSAELKPEPPKVSLEKPVPKKIKPVKRARRLSTKQAAPEKTRKVKPAKVYRVQMSKVWIELNLDLAVGGDLADDILLQGYSRHLFYTPFYLDSAREHANAVVRGNKDDHEAHRDHRIPVTHRYDEDEIKAAVNRKNILLGIKVVEM
jgi:hypothetical protein